MKYGEYFRSALS